MGLGFCGIWGQNPQLPEVIGGLEDSPPEARKYGNGAPALGNFCNFLIKITYFFKFYIFFNFLIFLIF